MISTRFGSHALRWCRWWSDSQNIGEAKKDDCDMDPLVRCGRGHWLWTTDTCTPAHSLSCQPCRDSHLQGSSLVSCDNSGQERHQKVPLSTGFTQKHSLDVEIICWYLQDGFPMGATVSLEHKHFTSCLWGLYWSLVELWTWSVIVRTVLGARGITIQQHTVFTVFYANE